MYDFFLILRTMSKIIEPVIVRTADGSKTIFHSESGEHYHSRHGATGESKHVFVGMGLEYISQHVKSEPIRILEIGFGTGLNFLLSADYAEENSIGIEYVGVEAYPLEVEVLQSLDFDEFVKPEVWGSFIQNYSSVLHSYPKFLPISSLVRLSIAQQRVLEVSFNQEFDLIYFDAFSTTHQPEMWTLDVLQHVTEHLVVGGAFVTYSITGSLKRSLKSLGFTIEKLPGAPGKREMLRAIKYTDAKQPLT